MKFIAEIGFPLEPFNTFVREGTVGQKIGETLKAIAPEVAYFTDNDVGRGMLMVVDVKDYSQLPHVSEPLFLAFDASVHWRIAIGPEDIENARLEQYATQQ